MFITIEGIDGCGKSTQAERLASRLRSLNRQVLWTHEPGDWSSGDHLRATLLGGTLGHPLTEVMLFMADRCEHVRQMILPALGRGEVVVCERYNDSTRAYQCWGRGVDRRKLESLIEWCALPEPDLTVLLAISPEAAAARRSSRGGADRIESEALAFHRRVADGFDALADEYPERIFSVDAVAPEDEISEEIFKELRRRLLL